MKVTKHCKRCKKGFDTYRDSNFCTQDCYLKSRFGDSKKCVVCGKKAQFRYCSARCRKDYWNKNGYRKFKKSYYWDKKIEIINELGGECIKCGNNDIRVLDINHIDRTQKKIPHKRAFTWAFRLKEWRENMDNIELLCANCHRVHTWEQMEYGKHC